jgi:predicted small secreted protein
MKPMKKMSFLVSLLLCAALLLSACTSQAGGTETGTETGSDTADAAESGEESGSESGADTEDDDVINRNPDMVYSYTEEQYETLCQKIGQLTELLSAGDRQEEFLTLYKDVEENDFEAMQDQYQIANVGSMVRTDSETAAALLEDISEKYNKVLQQLIEMYDDIDASPYAEAFFEGWTEEERAQAVASARSYTDELTDLKVASDKLMAEYRSLAYDDTFLQKSAEIYMRAVEQNKRIAQISGYDDYMEYAYELMYNRDYLPSDTAAMRTMVKEYLAPMLPTLLNKLQDAAATLTKADQADVNRILQTDVTGLGVVEGLGTTVQSVTDVLDAYFDSVSGDMKQTYYDMWNNNHYILTFNAEKSHVGAFSVYFYKLAYPMFYFGSGYQDLYTVVHEFGHCYAMEKSASMDIPLDLAEVNSQGNEWLFTSFLRDNVTSKAYTYLVTYRLLSDIASICNCVAVNDFEMYVYSHSDYTAETLDSVMEKVLRDLGIDQIFSQLYESPTSYWHYVTIDNPGYYISYAMSLLPSLELYAMSLDNYDGAAAAYLQLATVGKHDTFLGSLRKAGIGTPFDEQTYRDIAGIPGKLSQLLSASKAA